MKGGGDRVVNFIWRLCNMVFESGIVLEDWRSNVIVLLHKAKGERRECSNYKGTSLLSMVGKIYEGILVDTVCKVTEGLIDDEQGKGGSEQGGGDGLREGTGEVLASGRS